MQSARKLKRKEEDRFVKRRVGIFLKSTLNNNPKAATNAMHNPSPEINAKRSATIPTAGTRMFNKGEMPSIKKARPNQISGCDLK